MVRVRRNGFAAAVTAAVACLIGVAACHPMVPFDPDKIQLIERGVTDLDDIMEMFGAPESVYRVQVDSSIYLAWRYRVFPPDSHGTELIVLFDDDNAVHDYRYRFIYD